MSVITRAQLAVAAVGLLSAAPVAATELCVKCANPDASYACVVNAPSGGAMDTVTKLYCITALAKAGAHASCAVDRNSSPPCQGVRKELPIPAGLGQSNDSQPQRDAAAPPEVDMPTIVPSTPPPQGPSATAAAPPKTVQEMVEKSTQSAGDGLAETQKSADKAAKSAGTALEKAGTAVGDAAKSSWKCISSFFSNC